MSLLPMSRATSVNKNTNRNKFTHHQLLSNKKGRYIYEGITQKS